MSSRLLQTTIILLSSDYGWEIQKLSCLFRLAKLAVLTLVTLVTSTGREHPSYIDPSMSHVPPSQIPVPVVQSVIQYLRVHRHSHMLLHACHGNFPVPQKMALVLYKHRSAHMGRLTPPSISPITAMFAAQLLTMVLDFLAMGIQASPLSPQAVPKVTNPKIGSVWPIGTVQTVAWYVLQDLTRTMS